MNYPTMTYGHQLRFRIPDFSSTILIRNPVFRRMTAPRLLSRAQGHVKNGAQGLPLRFID
jgi:hypothetical protein